MVRRKVEIKSIFEAFGMEMVALLETTILWGLLTYSLLVGTRTFTTLLEKDLLQMNSMS